MTTNGYYRNKCSTDYCDIKQYEHRSESTTFHFFIFMLTDV